MRITNRPIVFLPCYAHQINLCVGEIFKESTDFKVTIDKAVHLATYFKNSNHKFFIAKLRDEQYAEYGKWFTIDAPGETQWNSFYTVCSSLARSQKALQVN